MMLVDKQFSRYHKYHKLFNHSNIKLSYSCIPSMKKAVQKYDLKIIENPKPVTNRTSYCQQKSKCLLDENCLSECLIYNAVANTYTIKNYHANCGKSFNERHSNHNSSF